MGICVIFNPAAKGEKARRFRRALEDIGSPCALKLTSGAGTGRSLAADAVRAGFDTLVAAGGDGTINEVVNGIGDEPGGFEQVRLGVLPVGTVNVFAREIGLPRAVPAAWKIILDGREASIDLPQMQFESQGQGQTRYFIQMAGAGWDARAIEMVSWDLKKKIGQFAYMIAGLKALRGPAPVITASDGSKARQGELVILGNGRYYGGQIPVFRDADLRDGLLDVVVFPRINWFVLFRYFCGYIYPRLYRPGPEEYFRSASLRMEADRLTPLEVDGENVGYLPAACSLRRQALRIIVA